MVLFARIHWLRDDSRLALHRDGDVFFQRLAELNHVPALRDRLRLVVTLVDRALVSIGPDFGSSYEFPGCFALASTSLVEHDAVASLLLPWLRAHAGFSVYDLYEPFPAHANYWNERFVKQTWGERDAIGYRTLEPARFGTRIENDVTLSHLATLQRRRVERIEVHAEAAQWPQGMLNHLRTAGGGLLRV